LHETSPLQRPPRLAPRQEGQPRPMTSPRLSAAKATAAAAAWGVWGLVARSRTLMNPDKSSSPSTSTTLSSCQRARCHPLVVCTRAVGHTLAHALHRLGPEEEGGITPLWWTCRRCFCRRRRRQRQTSPRAACQARCRKSRSSWARSSRLRTSVWHA
jgi:hypothetical protein